MTTNCIDESVDQAAIRTAILCKLGRDVEFLIPLHDGKNGSGPVAATLISEQTPAQDRRFDDMMAAVSRLETASQASGQDYLANNGPSRKRAPKFGATADSYCKLLPDTYGYGYGYDGDHPRVGGGTTPTTEATYIAEGDQKPAGARQSII